MSNEGNTANRNEPLAGPCLRAAYVDVDIGRSLRCLCDDFARDTMSPDLKNSLRNLLHGIPQE